MRRVYEFDNECKSGNYVVKEKVSNSSKPIAVYDNRTGSDAEYYRVYNKQIYRIEIENNLYTLYVISK